MSSRTGLVVAAVALIVGVGFGLYGLETGRKAQEEVATLRLALEEFEEREANRHAEAVAPPEEEVASPVSDVMSAAAATAESIDMASLLEQVVEQMEEPEAGPGSGGEAPNRSRGGFDARMLDSSARMHTNMQYAAYFREADLSPDQREAVREILETHSYEQMRPYYLDEDFEGETHQSSEDWDTWRDDALREALGPAGFEDFMAYEETKDVRMLDESFDIQLRLFSPGLRPEVHDYVRDSIVAEMIDRQQASMQDAAFGEFRMDDLFRFDELEARFEAELAPEDFREIQPFLEQQRMMQELMETHTEDAEASGS